MTLLFQNKPKRLFTFGCSFTDYQWATWANILGRELDCEFYNFGRSGSGNYFISNLVTQADSHFEFNKNDLVIVSWTNISREDRWVNRRGWLTPGNIYSQGEYDKKFVRSWANETHFALRDFSLIYLIDNLLKDKTQYHFLSMCDISKRFNQWEEKRKISPTINNLLETYNSCLSKILPSFYDVLWQDNLDSKWKNDWVNIHQNFSDGHPTILEHFNFLEKTFDHKFSNNTISQVNHTHEKWVEFIKKHFDKFNEPKGIYNLPQSVQAEMQKNYKIRDSDSIPSTILF